jgi:hypothetical protein
MGYWRTTRLASWRFLHARNIHKYSTAQRDSCNRAMHRKRAWRTKWLASRRPCRWAGIHRYKGSNSTVGQLQSGYAQEAVLAHNTASEPALPAGMHGQTRMHGQQQHRVNYNTAERQATISTFTCSCDLSAAHVCTPNHTTKTHACCVHKKHTATAA